MKQSGPPKRPTNMKLVLGTYRDDRAPTNEPQPQASIPKPPSHLAKEAKKEWKRISRQLAALGLLSEIDRAALAAYCETYADWITASLKVAEVGMVVKTQAGNAIENPFYSIKKRSMELMHKFLVEFGMTPASRTRIHVEQGSRPSEDPAAKYFRRSSS